jgi:hypothetical protein
VIQGWTAAVEKVEALIPPLELSGHEGEGELRVALRLVRKETSEEHIWGWKPMDEVGAIRGMNALEEVGSAL